MFYLGDRDIRLKICRLVSNLDELGGMASTK